jgi:predicted DNA-binding transcriptional regulator AlpA
MPNSTDWEAFLERLRQDGSTRCLIGVTELEAITGLSRPTLWRHHAAGLIPSGCKIGRSVRWRLRTGNPYTGILDWLDAGCPPRPEAASPLLTEGSTDGM